MHVMENILFTQKNHERHVYSIKYVLRASKMGTRAEEVNEVRNLPGRNVVHHFERENNKENETKKNLDETKNCGCDTQNKQSKTEMDRIWKER